MGANVWNIVNIIVGICVIVAAVMAMQGHWTNIVYQLCIVFFGLLICLYEIKWPDPLSKWYPFFKKWLGEGFFFLFLGCLIANSASRGWLWRCCGRNWKNGGCSHYTGSGCNKCNGLNFGNCGCFEWSFTFITGLALLILGVAYIIMHFVGCQEKPGPMQGEGGGGLKPGSASGVNCPPVVINIMLIICGVLIIVCSVIVGWGCWMNVVVKVFEIFLGVLVILHEITWPDMFQEYVGWLDDFLGEGVFFVFMSMLCWWRHDILGPCVLGVGIFMIVTYFVGCIQKPGPIQGGGGGSGDYNRW